MNDRKEIVIDANNVYKRYRIGKGEEQIDTLYGRLLHTLKAPIRNLRRLKKLRRFEEGEEYVNLALNGVSFTVNRGEVLGIIGPNGAGKSTLLKVLSKITEPTSGRIKIKGRVSALLEVGTGFHEELTGRDNIYLNGTILGMTKNEVEAKFDQIVDFSGVARYIDTPVKYYSSGMKVRLGFSVAAHLEPEILIIDEVLAVGDIAFQKKCLGKMDEVSHSGRTVLFVSHNMQMISQLCERVVVLENGIIAFDGDSEQAISYYNNQSVEIDSETGLGDKFRRRGAGQARISSFYLSDEIGNKKTTFVDEDKVRFNIDYAVNEDIPLMQVAIALKSGKTHELIASKRLMVSDEPLRAGQTGRIEITLKTENLYRSIYPLYLWLGNNIDQNLPLQERTYDVLDDLVKPMIIKSNSEKEEAGFFELDAVIDKVEISQFS